jgi:hypothetical protein
MRESVTPPPPVLPVPDVHAPAPRAERSETAESPAPPPLVPIAPRPQTLVVERRVEPPAPREIVARERVESRTEERTIERRLEQLVRELKIIERTERVEVGSEPRTEFQQREPTVSAIEPRRPIPVIVPVVRPTTPQRSSLPQIAFDPEPAPAPVIHVTIGRVD